MIQVALLCDLILVVRQIYLKKEHIVFMHLHLCPNIQQQTQNSNFHFCEYSKDNDKNGSCSKYV